MYRVNFDFVEIIEHEELSFPPRNTTVRRPNDECFHHEASSTRVELRRKVSVDYFEIRRGVEEIRRTLCSPKLEGGAKSFKGNYERTKVRDSSGKTKQIENLMSFPPMLYMSPSSPPTCCKRHVDIVSSTKATSANTRHHALEDSLNLRAILFEGQESTAIADETRWVGHQEITQHDNDFTSRRIDDIPLINAPKLTPSGSTVLVDLLKMPIRQESLPEEDDDTYKLDERFLIDPTQPIHSSPKRDYPPIRPIYRTTSFERGQRGCDSRALSH